MNSLFSMQWRKCVILLSSLCVHESEKSPYITDLIWTFLYGKDSKVVVLQQENKWTRIKLAKTEIAKIGPTLIASS